MTGGAQPPGHPFPDVRDVGNLLQRAGFTLPVVDAENYTVRYDYLFALMRDLRAMGMRPIRCAARSRKPLTRSFFLRAAELYAERYSDPDGRISATFSSDLRQRLDAARKPAEAVEAGFGKGEFGGGGEAKEDLNPMRVDLLVIAGLTRESICFAESFYEDGCAGQARE